MKSLTKRFLLRCKGVSDVQHPFERVGYGIAARKSSKIQQNPQPLLGFTGLFTSNYRPSCGNVKTFITMLGEISLVQGLLSSFMLTLSEKIELYLKIELHIELWWNYSFTMLCNSDIHPLSRFIVSMLCNWADVIAWRHSCATFLLMKIELCTILFIAHYSNRSKWGVGDI